MKIKKVNINMTESEYEEAVEYKETHGRPTWKEMIFELIKIKEEVDLE